MAGHDGYTRYTMRIPDALYERVKRAAGEKSVNAEIVATLEEAYPAPRDNMSEVVALIKDLAAKVRDDAPEDVVEAQSVALVDFIAEVQNVDRETAKSALITALKDFVGD